MQIRKFDALTCRRLRAELDKALATLPADLGVQVKLGKITFSENICSLKMVCAIKGEDGSVATEEGRHFVERAVLLGLKPEMLDKEFTAGGTVFVLKGYRVHAQDKPFIVLRKDDGKKYVMGRRPVYAGFGLTVPPGLE